MLVKVGANSFYFKMIRLFMFNIFCQCGSTCSRIENNVTPERLGVSLTSQQILVIEEQNEGHDPTNNAFSLS